MTSFSDQQIIRGLAMSISALYTSTACTIDAYRYDITCNLLLTTIVSHLSTVLVLRSFTTGQKLLALIRFNLPGCQTIFAGLISSGRLTTSFPTSLPNTNTSTNITSTLTSTNTTTLVLPAVCFQLQDAKPYSGIQDLHTNNHKDLTGFTTYIIIATFYFITVLFTLAHMFTHYFLPGTSKEVRDQEDLARRWTWFWWLGLIRAGILLAAWIIWAWSVAQLYQFRQWMMRSGWLGEEGVLLEDGWTFGQLLSVLMMAAAPLSVLTAWSGYKERHEEEKHARRRTVVSFLTRIHHLILQVGLSWRI